MRKIITFTVFLAVAVSLNAAVESQFVYEGITYKVLSAENGDFRVEVQSVKITDSEIISIPDTVEGRYFRYEVTSIGERAFSDLPDMEVLMIPKTVANISGKGVFENCSNLREIIVDRDNPYFTSIDGVVYNKDVTTLVIGPAIHSAIFVPESVVEIANAAFAYSNVERINTIASEYDSSSVKDTGDNDMEGFVLYLNEGITNIGESAFSHNVRLISATLPEGLAYLGKYAFAWAKSLESIELGNSLTVIPAYAFFSCYAMETVTLPPGVTKIESFAFSSCLALKSIIMSIDLEVMELWGISYTPSLENIVIPEDNMNFSAEGTIVFNKDKTKLVLYLNPAENLVLPEGIEIIGSYAVCDYHLVTLTLPTTLNYIEDYAFYMSGEDLKWVKCLSLIPPGVQSFSIITGSPVSDNRDEKNFMVFFPWESRELYENAYYWKNTILTPIRDTGVDNIGEDTVISTYPVQVYSLDGRVLLNANRHEDLNLLPKGLYIVNGRKIVKN